MQASSSYPIDKNGIFVGIPQKLSPFRETNIGLNRARASTAIEIGGIHPFNLGRDVMRVLKFFLIGAGVVLLIPIGIAVWFFSSGGVFGECEMQELARSKSPSHTYEAMVYTKGCGATTPTATIVALRRDKDAFEDMFIVEAAGDLGVEWLGSDQLNIIFPKGIAEAEVFREIKRWEGVSVRYSSK